MNDNNLIPLTKRPPEEAREIRSKGGAAASVVLRRKKVLREICQAYLDGKIETKDGKKIPVADTIIEKQILKALGGSTVAAAFIRDTSGQKPKDTIEHTGELSLPQKPLSDAELKEGVSKVKAILEELS